MTGITREQAAQAVAALFGTTARQTRESRTYDPWEVIDNEGKKWRFVYDGSIHTVSYTHLATSREEIGNPVYPPARRKLAEHGISCDGHAARQLTNQDYDKYDLLIGMDSANLRNMYRICGGDFAGKLHLLMDYTCLLYTSRCV